MTDKKWCGLDEILTKIVVADILPFDAKKEILEWIEKEILGEWPNKCSDCRTQMIERLRK